MIKTLFRSVRRAAAALLLLCCTMAAEAATEITGYVWITNTPAGLTTNIVINIGAADTRHWTNSAAGAPSTSIQLTNSTAASRTNLYQHLVAYPVYSAGAGTPQILVQYNATNTSVLNFTAPANTNLTVTFGGLWASVTYVTNTYSDAAAILNRTNAMSAAARTNAENAIVNLLAANRATNAVPTNSTFLRNYVDTNTPHTVANKTLVNSVVTGGRWTGVTNLVGTNVAVTNVTAAHVSTFTGVDDAVRITNGVAMQGTVHRFQAGYYSDSTLDRPTSTNLINYGNAVRSEGSGGNSLQLGSNALAIGNLSMAVGNGAVANGLRSTAIGVGAVATNGDNVAIGTAATARTNYSVAIGSSADAKRDYDVAIGYLQIVEGPWAIGIGYGGSASKAGAIQIGNGGSAFATNAVAVGGAASGGGKQGAAFGFGAAADHDDATAIGTLSATTSTNQVMLGTSVDTVAVPGRLITGSITNATLTGTNIHSGIEVYTPVSNSGLANGYNAAVGLSAVHVRLSGPTAGYTNAGFSALNAMDGRMHWIQAANPGLSFTLLHDSGLDGDTNRIYTGTGALMNSTNNPVQLIISYDTSVSRWRVWSFR